MLIIHKLSETHIKGWDSRMMLDCRFAWAFNRGKNAEAVYGLTSLYVPSDPKQTIRVHKCEEGVAMPDLKADVDLLTPIGEAVLLTMWCRGWRGMEAPIVGVSTRIGRSRADVDPGVAYVATGYDFNEWRVEVLNKFGEVSCVGGGKYLFLLPCGRKLAFMRPQ